MDQILVETIETYNEYLSKLPEGCSIIAGLLRDDQIALAMDNIVNLSEGLQWVLQVSELLEKNEIETNIKAEEINGFLVEINEAINNEDYYLVADIMEYELIEFFEKVQMVQINQ